jgi:hypothetical protein
MMLSVAAMTASTICVGLVFLYALIAPTLPLPDPAITKAYAMEWTGPGEPRVVAIHAPARRNIATR